MKPHHILAPISWHPVPAGDPLCTLLWLIVMMLTVGATAPAATSPVWHYQLLPGSYLIDDCPPCGRPTLREAMIGTFDLRLVEENPLFSKFVMENITLTSGSVAGRAHKIVGKGMYQVGGEVALVQDMTLEVSIDDGTTNRLCQLTNATPHVERLWPMIDSEVVQTNGTFTQVYHLHLFAAPFVEIWFSTGHITRSNSRRGRPQNTEPSRLPRPAWLVCVRHPIDTPPAPLSSE